MLRGRGAAAGNPVDLLVVGLGNPGDKYRHSRHNVGADTVELLCQRWGERLRAGSDFARSVAVRRPEGRCLLAVPTTFMNDSGRAVGALVRRHSIEEWSHLVVVHDELDLEPDRLKIKLGGGLAGHNGLRSIVDHIHTNDFTRVRIGIGKPPGGRTGGTRHVLSPLTGPSRELAEIQIQRAADAVECILAEGVPAAMRTFNGGG